MVETDGNGLFDAPRHEDLTLIMMFDRRVGLSLFRGERVSCRFLFCGDEKLGCMVERTFTAVTDDNGLFDARCHGWSPWRGL